MARLHLTSLATGPHPISFGLSAQTPIVLQTDFDYYTAWVIACQRDDQEGEREEAEVAELRGDTPEDVFPRMPDFDPPSEDESVPSSPPPSRSPSPSLHASTSLSSDSIENLGFTNIIRPSPQPCTSTTTNSMPEPDSEPEPVADGSNKRRRTTGSKQSNKARKDRKKKRQVEERRADGALPVHGQKYVQRYLHPDVVERDFDVIQYRAVKGGDTGKNEPKGAKKKCVASLEEGRENNYGLFNWDGKFVQFPL